MTYWKPERTWLGTGAFNFDLVGESSYQPALSDIARGPAPDGVEVEVEGVLMPEPDNPHDKLAIAAFVDGKRIGYIPRTKTREYYRVLAEHGFGDQPIGVAILVTGGWHEADGSHAHYGAKLDMDWPPVPDMPGDIVLDRAAAEAHRTPLPLPPVVATPLRLDTQQEMLIEQRVANEAKSAGVAYALWFFLGILSLHRFYLGRPGTAVLQILSYFILIGFVWWLVDAFLIPSMIDQHKQQVRTRMMERFVKLPSGPEPDMSKWSIRDKTAYAARQK